MREPAFAGTSLSRQQALASCLAVAGMPRAREAGVTLGILF
jgi:hypothetical protein